MRNTFDILVGGLRCREKVVVEYLPNYKYGTIVEIKSEDNE